MKKYDPLEEYLLGLTKSGKDEWSTSFKSIENIIGRKLPPSAFKHEEWWANESEKTTKVQCHAWRRAGWKTSSKNLSAQTVTFVKVPSNHVVRGHLSKKKLCL